MADLSIIIVSYNAREHLRRCLQSVERASGKATVQTLVIDNGSTDGSAETVSSTFPWVQLIRNERNLGFAAAANVGLDRAAGRYLFLLNSDTILTEGALDRIVAFMDSRPDAAACGCRLLNPDGSVQPSCRMMAAYSLRQLALNASGLHRLLPASWTSHDPGLFLRFGYDEVRAVDFVSGAALVIREQALISVGYLDERFFLYGEEMDWCYRCRQRGLKILFFPAAEVVHLGGVSASSRTDLAVHLCRGRYQFVAKHFGAVRTLMFRLLLAFKHMKALLPAALDVLRRSRPGADLLRLNLGVLKWLLTLAPASAEGSA